MTHRIANKRRLTTAIAALGAAALLATTAACGTAGPTSSTTPSDTGSTAGTTASVWILSGVTQQPFEDSFQRWDTAHPDQAFTSEAFANDPYKQKIAAAIGTGQAPTLIYGWGGGGLRTYVQANAVIDLSDVMADPDISSRFLPSVAAVGEVDGKYYAVPNNGMKPVMIYYNKDLFAQVGVSVPTTWDDLMADVPKFLAAGIAPFSVAGQAQWPLLPYFAYLVDRIGGPTVMANIAANQANAWSDPAVADALTKIQDLVNAGGFVKGFASISTDAGADVALLYTGKAAMDLGLPSTFQTIMTGDPDFINQGKLGFAEFPAVTGGKGDPKDVTGNPSNYWSISASATPGQVATAKQYIKEQLLTPQYAADLLSVGNVPPAAGIDAQLAASSNADYYTLLYNMVKDAPNFQLSLDQYLSPAVGTALLTNLQQIFLMQSTPQQFVDAMNATIGQ